MLIPTCLVSCDLQEEAPHLLSSARSKQNEVLCYCSDSAYWDQLHDLVEYGPFHSLYINRHAYMREIIPLLSWAFTGQIPNNVSLSFSSSNFKCSYLFTWYNKPEPRTELVAPLNLCFGVFKLHTSLRAVSPHLSCALTFASALRSSLAMLIELYVQAKMRGVVSSAMVQLGSAPKKSKNSTASAQSAVNGLYQC